MQFFGLCSVLWCVISSMKWIFYSERAHVCYLCCFIHKNCIHGYTCIPKHIKKTEYYPFELPKETKKSRNWNCDLLLLSRKNRNNEYWATFRNRFDIKGYSYDFLPKNQKNFMKDIIQFRKVFDRNDTSMRVRGRMRYVDSCGCALAIFRILKNNRYFPVSSNLWKPYWFPMQIQWS